MNESKSKIQGTENTSDEVTELELTDEDILDAMQHIPGYLDISTEDFRIIYHLAHRHALGRQFGNLRADRLMRTGIVALTPDIMLDEAAIALVRSSYKALPVVDAKGCVIGILTENDYLRRLNVSSFLELLLSLLDHTFELKHKCHETPVSQAMTTPVITVNRQAGFMEIIAAFHRHAGRSLPVVNGDGHLLGLLLRKDILSACHMENLL
ncbi:MAG: HPP family protein [Gallionellaceae bacterium]|jgi:CBS domain-containing membrane protein